MLFETQALRRERDGRTLFASLDFALSESQTLAVVGPSGSGKTSLLRILAGLDGRDGGDILLDGRGIDAWEMPRWRAQVLYVAQRPPVFSGTPAELAAHVALFRIQRARTIDDPVALASGWGLDAKLWERSWADLSGGEQQRAALAIAVSRRPRVLLLDEPTSALDARARAAVEASLRGLACLWVTHDPAQAERVADAVIDLGDAGR